LKPCSAGELPEPSACWPTPDTATQYWRISMHLGMRFFQDFHMAAQHHDDIT
jgi:hypothetical protein